MTNVTVELPAGIEIVGPVKFAFWAELFNIEVPERGRKDAAKRKLAQAILDNPDHHIVDTEYFNAAMAENKTAEPSEYGAKLKEARATRDAAITAANETFERARAELRAKYNVPDNGTEKAKTGNAYKVSARVPLFESDGQVKRTKSQGDKPGKVRFGPGRREVTLTNAQVRELAPNVGDRGRPSKSHTVYAAAVAGEWLPVELMTVKGWESVLLADLEVEPVTVELEAAS
jgi:hypothetical protein